MRYPWLPPVSTTLLALVFLSACSSSSPASSTLIYPTYTFNCCPASDLQPAWHPAQVVSLHWASTPGTLTADNQSHPITITAVLAGPYPDVPTLKAATTAARELPLATIRTNDRVPSLPASMVTLPPDLTPGFYNLDFKFDYGGGISAGGASIVYVAP